MLPQLGFSPRAQWAGVGQSHVISGHFRRVQISRLLTPGTDWLVIQAAEWIWTLGLYWHINPTMVGNPEGWGEPGQRPEGETYVVWLGVLGCLSQRDSPAVCCHKPTANLWKGGGWGQGLWQDSLPFSHVSGTWYLAVLVFCCCYKRTKFIWLN